MHMVNEVVKEYYLAHHGILGQRWGVRNGPPYPLDASKHSKEERKAASENSKTVGGLSQESAQMIGIASAFVGVVAVQSVSKLIRNKQRIKKGRELVQKFEIENASNPKSKKSIHSQDINPLNGKMNCGACCIAEEMRLRGVSCAAKDINGMLIEDVAACFKGATENSFDKLSPDCIEPNNGEATRNNLSREIAKKYPEGSRGTMYVPMWFGNHYITWEVQGGRTVFRNPQDTNLDLTKNCFAAMVKSGTVGSDQIGIRTMRWDNLEPKKDSIDEILYTDQGSLDKHFYGEYK